MHSQNYLTSASEDGVFTFRSSSALHKFLGIHNRFENCIAYAPYAKYAPNCSRPLNWANQQKRPGLLTDLMEAKIPSRRARLLLREISRCVVCGVTGWHQSESEKIFTEWCQRLWHIYLRADGLEPDLCLPSPAKMNRRIWLAGLETARSEHEAQLETESESRSEEETDVSSSDDGSDDDDDDDDDDDELVILTPRSSASNLAQEDELASIPPSSPVDHFSFREDHISLRSAVPNQQPRQPTTSSRSSTVTHPSHHVAESVVSVTQRKSALQKSSARLQVYRDPLPSSSASPTRNGLQPVARESDSTTRSSPVCPPIDTRRALGALDRNVDANSQDRGLKPQSGPSRPRAGSAEAPVTKLQPTQNTPASVHVSVGDADDDQPTRSTQTETIQQSDSEVIERLVRNGIIARIDNSRPCSRCRGTGYRLLDNGPLATEDDMLQMLSQFDLTEEDDSTSPNTPPSPTSKGFRLYPQLSPQDNMKAILNTILQHSGPRNRAPGYIYAFTRPSLPGFVKIGYTSATEQPDRPYPHPVDFRLARWASDCGFPVTEVFREYMPCAAERMESLIHQTLRAYRRIQDPVCRPCQRRRGGRGGGAHDEWFEVGVEAARQVVRSWALFSKQRPYDSFGAPVKLWAEKAEQERRAKHGLSLEQWLERMPQYVEEVRRLDFRSILDSWVA